MGVSVGHIELTSLTKQFGSNVVVDGIDLDILDGEFIVLLGPSGCGKTTVLRMIAGLEQINGGQLYFDGQLMNSEPPDRRNVGMVFQNYALYPHMTVEKNLAFGLQSRKRTKSRSQTKKEIRNQVLAIAKLLDIDHLLEHRPKQLSGGQRQRVALGRALIRKPSVFLMDEPLSNLDANLRERVRMELASLHQQVAVTTVYVTHDQVEALTLASRVVVMNEGKVLQVGTPGEVYNFPSNSFVAHFIGTPGMNLWNLTWDYGDSDITLGSSVKLAREFLPILKESGDRVLLGIRPEHLKLKNPNDRTAVTVDFQIQMVEHLGSHQLAHGFLSNDPAETGIVQLDSKEIYRSGDRLELAASHEQIHLFEVTSGKRLNSMSFLDESIMVEI